MTRLRRLGLRTRLAIALVGIAVLAVGIATLLSNRGLHPRVTEAAEARLERSAEHMAGVAAAVYREEGGWSAEGAETLEHLARLNRIELRLYGPRGRRIDPGHGHPALATATASAPVVVAGRPVGRIVIGSPGGELLTPEEEHLQVRLDRLHLVAGAVSIVAALLLALLLAQTLSRPLRRIRLAAERIEAGDLQARVELSGEDEVRSVGHALNRLAETLQHEEEARKASVADLAHELRTPVNGLLARIEAAQDGVLADEAANLEAMHSETLRLVRLLNDLAKLADAERPGLLLEKRPLDLAEVVALQLEAFAPRFEAKGVELTSGLEPAVVNGDADRLGQIAANLLSNALRYTEPGGTVHVRVAADGELAVLEVSDTGIGIAADDLKHIFKRFWRGERSRSRATGGAGIGLAIVEELARAHEGRVDVESAPGHGSTFRVFLRRLPADLRQGERSASRDLQTAARR